MRCCGCCCCCRSCYFGGQPAHCDAFSFPILTHTLTHIQDERPLRSLFNSNKISLTTPICRRYQPNHARTPSISYHRSRIRQVPQRRLMSCSVFRSLCSRCTHRSQVFTVRLHLCSGCIAIANAIGRQQTFNLMSNNTVHSR